MLRGAAASGEPASRDRRERDNDQDLDDRRVKGESTQYTVLGAKCKSQAPVTEYSIPGIQSSVVFQRIRITKKRKYENSKKGSLEAMLSASSKIFVWYFRTFGLS